VLAAVFAAGLLVRLLYAYEIRDLPTQHELVMDAQHYDALARGILDGGWRPREPFHQAPLYPYLLAAVYALSGRSLAAMRLVQAVLGALTAVLAAVAAARLYDTRGRRGQRGQEERGQEQRGQEERGAQKRRLAAAAIAGGLAALYAPAVFYTPLLLKTVPALFLESAALVLLLPPRGSRLSAGRGLAGGLVLGAAALLLENLLLLVPAAALFVLLAGRRHASYPEGPRGGSRSAMAASVAPALALAAGAALALAPAALLNHAVGGGFLLTSSQGGMNFYIGNSRGANGTFVPMFSGNQTPEREPAEARRLAAPFAARERDRSVGPPAARTPAQATLGPAEVSGVLWRETWREIAADPAAWLRLMLRKLRLFWNAYEIPDAEGFRVYRRESALLRFDPVVFGLVAPLAALGLLAAVRRPGTATPPATPATPAVGGGPAAGPQRCAALLLATLGATTCASVLLFFVLGRYRIAVVPYLLPLAAAGILELIEIAKLGKSARGRARPALDLALLAGVGLAVNLPCLSSDEVRRHDAAIEYNLGAAADRWSAACFADFQRLGAVAGTASSAASAAGSAEAARRRLVQAARLASRAAAYLDEAARGSPGFFAAEIEWANAVERRGSCFAAAGDFARAAADFSAARERLLGALAASRAGADPELDRAARRMLATLATATATALSNQAVQLVAAGRLDEAGAALSRAAALAPALPAPRGSLGLYRYELGMAARRRGAEAEARRLFRQSGEAYRQAVLLAGAAGRPDLAALYTQGLRQAQTAEEAAPTGR
jgi:hypothetical protein